MLKDVEKLRQPPTALEYCRKAYLAHLDEIQDLEDQLGIINQTSLLSEGSNFKVYLLIKWLTSALLDKVSFYFNISHVAGERWFWGKECQECHDSRSQNNLGIDQICS